MRKRNSNMSKWREMFCNPSPPIDYVPSEESPKLELKEPFRIIEGVRCKFLGLIMDSGVLECDHPWSDYDLEVSSDEEEIKVIPFEKKPPLFVDLDESSEGVVSSSPECCDKESQENQAKPLSENVSQSKSPSGAPGAPSSTKPLASNSDAKTTNKDTHLPSTSKSSSHAKSGSVASARRKEESSLHSKETRKKDSYSSKYSSSSNHSKKSKHRREKLPRSYSRSTSSSSEDEIKKEDINLNIKEEYGYQDYDDGYWYCELCQTHMTSEGTYYCHLKGKRHLKAVKQQNIGQAIAATVKSAAALSLGRPAHAKKLPERHFDFSVPDTSKGDFFCQVCDSHMNNRSMWEAHILGKRHLSNLKKNPGQAPSKTKSVRVPNLRPKLLDQLKYETEPVVGLDFIKETQTPESNEAMYNCYLCGAYVMHLDVVDHIVSQKHRIKYLERIGDEEYKLLTEFPVQESAKYGLIREICEKVERKKGKGRIEVYLQKST